MAMNNMNFTKRIMPIIIIIYGGMLLNLLPNYLYNINDVIRELLLSTGMVLMIGGVVWFFYDKLSRRLNKAVELIAGPISNEVNEIKLIRGEDLAHLFRSYYGMSEIKIIIDIRSIGRWSHEFIDNLANKMTVGRTKLIITGYREGNNENLENPESNFFFHQISKIQKEIRDGERLNIKVCDKASNNTVILGKYNITLIFPFDLKGKYLFYVDAKSNSDFLESYQRHFDELWQNSTDYSIQAIQCA